VKRLIVAIAIGFGVATYALAEVYTWRSEDGGMHVEETPPPRSCKSQDCKEIHSAIDQAQKKQALEQQRIRDKETAEKDRVKEAAYLKEIEASRKSKAREEELRKAYQNGYSRGKSALEGEYKHAPDKAYKVCTYNSLLERDETVRNYYRDYFRDQEVREAYANGCSKATSRSY